MRTTIRAAAPAAAGLLLVSVAGQALAADLKADLSLTQGGIQQNHDVGNVVGGSTITFTDNLFLQGGPDRLTSATFDDDGNLPVWVSSVTGGTAYKGATNAVTSTITVVAPCAIGGFGADGGDSKVSGSSVQYAVSAVNTGASLSDVTVGTAWVNIRGNVTSLGPNCSTTPSDTASPANASVVVNTGDIWTNSATGIVSVALSATDNVGVVKYRLAETRDGLASASNVEVTGTTSFSGTAAFTLSEPEANIKQVWARFYDAAGNSVDASDSIGWDKTGPVVTDDSTDNPPTGTAGSGSWYVSPVTVTFKAADNVSGFASMLTNPHTFTRSTAVGSEGSAVKVNSGPVNDVAGNTSNTLDSAPFQIDLYDPTVTCTTPAPTFVLGSTGEMVMATVSDTANGSGAASPTASAAADTTSVGVKTVSVTGYDNAGRPGLAACSYNVIYDWTGFFRPVDNLPTLNSVKAGSAVPVKFDLGGNQGLSVMATGFPKSQVISCDSTANVDGVEETVTAGSSSLSYDTVAGHYTYVWKTDKSWAGSCRQLVVKLADGTEHRANFKLLK